MTDSPIKNVSDTAFMVAAYRAAESARPNALFSDPLAAKLAGEHGRRIVDSLPKKAFIGGWSVVIRTRIIDSFILAAVAEGVDLVLNLGAGLDTRPYRMDLPESLRWIEVDYPHVIELKETELSSEKPRCQLERVKLDLADLVSRKKFLEQTAARSKKILVLTEGAVPYLSEEEVASLGADLLAMKHVKYWIVDYFSPESYRYRKKSGMSRALKNAPFLFEPMDFFGFFSAIGWKSKQTKFLAEEGERLNRPAPFPWMIRALTRVLGMLASSERRQKMKQYAGYVLFEAR